jgi:pyruvate/2-oxoglutarate dehydrogenase complex dihydrolipoamide dehydrogenase (E3) component
MDKYDVLIIGSGQAGKPLAVQLGKAGRKTAIIEKAHVGGTCVNAGCTPTKTMVASARVAYLARRGADYGVRGTVTGVDMVKVRQRKRAIVESFRSGGQNQLEHTENVTLLMGEAHFVDRKVIEVNLNDGGKRQLSAEVIVINAGCRPTQPKLPGLDRVPFLDSTSIMELDQVPEHLLVLGGGYIGLEFGQMFRRFGSRVTVVQRGGQLLGREDADVAEAVLKLIREDGIEVHLEAEAVGVERHSDGAIALRIRTATGEQELSGTHLLVAVGRSPNTDGLGTAAAGVRTDSRGFILVNERLETNMPGIYAAGDVNGGPAFTHISYDDFRILRGNLLENANATTTGRLVPYTVFIDPQLGRVGLSEVEAKAQGRSYQVARIPMTHVARALEVDESRGFMKALVDVKSREIIGCAVLGIEGGEVMAMLQIAMMGRVPYTALRDGIFAHPTLAESLNTLFGTLS